MKPYYVCSYLRKKQGCKQVQHCDGEINKENKLEIHKVFLHHCRQCKGRYLIKIKRYLFLLLDKRLKTCEIFMFRRKDHNLIINKDFFSGVTDETITILGRPNLDDNYHQLQYLEERTNNATYTPEQCLASISDRELYKLQIDKHWAAKKVQYEMHNYYSDPKKSVLNYQLQLPNKTPLNKELRGIILGHGHKHDIRPLPTSVPSSITWTLVDINPESKPDIIGGYDCMETVEQLGLHKWDYVFASYCPWRGDGIFLAARYLLNNSGQFILNNFVSRYEETLEEESKLFTQRNHYKRYCHEDSFSVFYVT